MIHIAELVRTRRKLTESEVSTTGVVIASYVPDGEVKYGSFVTEEVSEAELARREKWSRE